jgi:hypothetical protein
LISPFPDVASPHPARALATWVIAGLVALALWRGLASVLAGLPLHFDEAQYWGWSRELAWGYYSKPPGIAAAIRALGRADAVFGPAEDGGYWLVGMGPRRPARPFAGVRWSSGHTLADTLRNFAGRRVALLRRLRDVDTAEDLAALRAGA